MKVIFLLVTLVVTLYAKSYTMKTQSLGSLKARLIADNLYHKYMEEHYLRRGQILKKGSEPFLNFQDYYYTGNITIGTPGQEVSLVLDTGTSNLWVIDAKCTTFGCNGNFGSSSYKRRKFNTTASSTFSTKNIPISIGCRYGGTSDGIRVNDTVSFAGFVPQCRKFDKCITGLTIEQQEFATALSMDNIFASVAFDGIFGLGWPAVATDRITPPMQNILPSLDAPLFTIWMDKKFGRSMGNTGLITYGAIDTTNCESDINYVPLSSGAYWQFHMEGFSTGTFSKTRTEEATADTGTAWFGAPHYITSAVMEQTGAQFSIIYGIYTVDCSTMTTQPDLVFSINGVKYSVPSEEYVLDMGIGDGKCVVAFYDTNSGGFGGPWILGDPWFRSVCNIFDIGQQRIGLAKGIHSKI